METIKFESINDEFISTFEGRDRKGVGIWSTKMKVIATVEQYNEAKEAGWNVGQFWEAENDLICFYRYEKSQEQIKKETSETRNKQNAEKRTLAKMFGGKALKGNTKDKTKAEEIRANVLNCTKNEDDIVYLVKHYAAQSTKFWIDIKINHLDELKKLDTLTNNFLQLQNEIHSESRKDGHKAGVLAGELAVAYDKARKEVMTQRVKVGL